MPFDFDAAVTAPFRMQPGLRRMAPGAAHLTPQIPGSPHQRAKLAVLTRGWQQALCVEHGFDATAALAALCAHAAAEQPQAFGWDGARATAHLLGLAVGSDGDVDAGTAVAARDARTDTSPTEATDAARAADAGVAAASCLLGLPPHARLGALLSLTFAEDMALLDGSSGTLPWLAVALPSHWAPEAKVGRHFSEVHAPVADNALLMNAADGLLRLVTDSRADARWERFVWSVSDSPDLDAHPARVGVPHPPRWRQAHAQGFRADAAWWRTEHQTFIPLSGLDQAVFTIHVEVDPLAEAVATPARAAALHAAISSMSPAVIAYRGLAPVREPLLAWLASRT